MSADICAKCGQEHGACNAHSKRTGGPCRSVNVEPGGLVCSLHGGKSPQAKKAAAKREATRIVTELYGADANATIAAMGVEPVTDPLEMLGQLAAASTHMMDALGQRVNALDEVTSTSDLGVESIRAVVSEYGKAMDRTGKLLDLLVKAGFMDRAIKVQEGTAEAVVAVLRRVFDRLELSPEQLVLVGTVVPEELRALEVER